MPIYEYECTSCGRVHEVMQKISEAPLTECSYCKGKLHKLISQSSFHLKGSGWYVTDYGSSSSKGTSGAAKTKSSGKKCNCAGSTAPGVGATASTDK